MPRPHRNSNETAALLGRPPPPPHDTQAQRPKLRPEDICVGCIVWLPQKDVNEGGMKCRKDGCCQNSELEEKGYNHPVVVLEIKQRKNSRTFGDLVCVVACITTFQDMPLKTYLVKRKRIAHYQTSTPIKVMNKVKPEALDINQLTLEKGRNLYKQSYIKTDHLYMIPVDALRSYGFQHRECRAYKLRLDVHSYTTLMKDLEVPPSSYVETNTLFETAAVRLAVLAGSSQSAIVPTPRVQTPVRQPAYPSTESHLDHSRISSAHAVPTPSTYSSHYPSQPPVYQSSPVVRQEAYIHSTYLGYQQNSQSSQTIRPTRPSSYQPPVYIPYTSSVSPSDEPESSYWGGIIGFLALATVCWLGYKFG